MSSVSITVTGDTCQVEAWGFTIRGLTPEQAVEVKKFILYGYSQGGHEFYMSTLRSMQKLQDEPQFRWGW